MWRTRGRGLRRRRPLHCAASSRTESVQTLTAMLRCMTLEDAFPFRGRTDCLHRSTGTNPSLRDPNGKRATQAVVATLGYKALYPTETPLGQTPSRNLYMQLLMVHCKSRDVAGFSLTHWLQSATPVSCALLQHPAKKMSLEQWKRLVGAANRRRALGFDVLH